MALCEVCRDKEPMDGIRCQKCGKKMCGACASGSKYTPLLCPRCEELKDVELTIQTARRCLDALEKKLNKLTGEDDGWF